MCDFVTRIIWFSPDSTIYDIWEFCGRDTWPRSFRRAAIRLMRSQPELRFQVSRGLYPGV